MDSGGRRRRIAACCAARGHPIEQNLSGIRRRQVLGLRKRPLFASHVTRLSKMLAQYELYKTIIGLPSHVVECGVYKGASLRRFATFREILENPYSRKIIGFDAFGQFPVGDEDAANGAAFATSRLETPDHPHSGLHPDLTARSAPLTKARYHTPVVKYSLIDLAARRPAPIARITVAPPVTMSPPAKMPLHEVLCVTSSATM